jgi:hypothetical protein
VTQACKLSRPFQATRVKDRQTQIPTFYDRLQRPLMTLSFAQGPSLLKSNSLEVEWLWISKDVELVGTGGGR